MLELRRMTVLLEVSERGSIHAAARALSYTPSAVSQQVSTLEREVGQPLLERLPRGVVLTEAGHVLVGHTRRILRQMQAAEAELTDIGGMRSGTLRLGTFPTAGASLVPLAITDFRHRFPGIRLEVRSAKLAGMVELLETRAVEFGMLWDYGWRRIDDDVAFDAFDTVHLLDDPMDVVLPRGHPLAREEQLSMACLAHEEWVTRADGHPSAEALGRASRAAGFEPEISFEAHDYQEAQAIVAAGVGISLVPRLALVNVREDVTVLPLDGTSPVRRILLARLTHRPQTATAEAMFEIFHGVAARVRESWGDTRPG